MQHWTKIIRRLAGLKAGDDDEGKNAQTSGKKAKDGVSRKKLDFKLYIKIFHYTWPFLLLAIIIVFGWNYAAPFFKDLAHIGDRFNGQEEPSNRDPDADYKFMDDQAALKPVSAAELGLSEQFVDPEASGISGEKVSGAAELEKALKAAGRGDIIILAPGTYRVNLKIERSAHLVGSGANTVLTAAGDNLPIIAVNGTSTAVENLIIEGGRIGLSVQDGDLTAARIKFTGLTGAACFAQNSTLNLTYSWISGSGSGIKVFGGEGKINHVIVRSNEGAGITLENSRFNIEANNVSGNGSYGVFADTESQVNITGNAITGNKGFNVRIEGEKEIYR